MISKWWEIINEWWVRLFWIFYLVIGAIAAFISYYIESIVFSEIFENIVVMSWIIVLVFESAKIATIVLHRLITYKNKNDISVSVKFINFAFKIGLISLSIGCSISLVSKFLDAPNLEIVQKEDIKYIDDEYKNALEMLNSAENKTKQEKIKIIQENYKNEREYLKNSYEPLIREAVNGIRY